MQQTFQCHSCGSLINMGHKFCVTCGQQFQYYCPNCGNGTDAQFNNCMNCGKKFPWQLRTQAEPSMHILTLDPLNKLLVGFVDQLSTVYLPAIAANGRLTGLNVSMERFQKVRSQVYDLTTNEFKKSKTHIFVGVKFYYPADPIEEVLIGRLAAYGNRMPELEEISGLVSKLRSPGDKYWQQVGSYLNDETRKSFINRLLLKLRRDLNWKDYVDQELNKWRIEIGQSPYIQHGSVCINCGLEVIPGQQFCSGCGTAAGSACPYCGNSISIISRFCSSCGSKLGQN